MVKDIFKRYWTDHRHEIIGLVLLSVVLFIVISVITFHPEDPSLIFFSTHHMITHNWCGAVGAQVGGFLVYLFGGAAMLGVLTMLYGVLCVFRKEKIQLEVDRIGAWWAFIILAAAMSSLYHIDWPVSGYAGGYIGYYTFQGLHRLFDTTGTSLFLYTALIITTMIMFRISFLQTASRFFMQVKNHAYAMYERMHINHTVFGGIYVVQRLFTGSIIILRAGGRLALPNVWRDARALLEEPSDDALCAEFSFYASDDAFVYEDLPTVNDISVQNSVEKNEQYKEASVVRNSQKISFDHFRTFDHSTYHVPRLSLKKSSMDEKQRKTEQSELQMRAKVLEEKLAHFGITGTVVDIKRGPVVTLFEYEPAADMKLSKILSLEDDLAMALQAIGIRILAPIPGRSVVGFEVANGQRSSVSVSDVMHSSAFQQNYMLPLILGHDTVGDPVVVDLARMPHLLIAGSTGSGKSVGLNAMLVSLLCSKKPSDIQLILIDPKRLEFSAYADIAHLIFPIVSDPKRAVHVLKWVIEEMERRYDDMADIGGRNLEEYNAARIQAGKEPLPSIVVVIDELADLMMTAGKEVEDLITRIGQMARAAGIHMIVATQRPSVDVITGLIKVNFPSRIAFRVTSKVDSRTILDTHGAERLLGRGDMLFLDAHHARLTRVHGAYVTDDEIESLVNAIKKQASVCYQEIPDPSVTDSDIGPEDEELFDAVMVYLQEVDDVSISLLQRKFKIGYNRSARIIDALESQGLVSTSQGGKTRKVVRDL